MDRLGFYLHRDKRSHVAVFFSKGLYAPLLNSATVTLNDNGITQGARIEIADNDIQSATLFADLPGSITAVVGIGGGKALDVAKYVSFLNRLPYYAVPTSLSNDGFCSSRSSLTIHGKRRSLPAAIPYGVIIDTAVCLAAPRILTLSGIGDLVAKFTAVKDWKLAFHTTGEPVDDFSALLADASIHAYLSHPSLDLEGIRLLATALLLSGISMEVCGSSRPASGSEHLISHALDSISQRPRLHGLQVGVATYLVSILQGANSDRIAALFDTTGFWSAIAEDPFSRSEWLAAIQLAPSIKGNYYTVLSSRDVMPEVEQLLVNDPHLKACFGD